MNLISYLYEGTNYEAEWDFVDDDNIIIYLPEGPRETWLGGLRPEITARNHLRAYAHNKHKKQPKTIS
ncbi:hypothetical protein KW830_05480 [Comamonas sp. CMM03]|uniref:hypothetical protein n=1 Tax=Comamonas sp. CMM03 TaxID=2854781 RepID=UPI001C4415AE|nr:hypothetical protein [Comamonas sp. CMM03]MBV7417903.1 hypothetical protein [Comamonas sp. CMM03]